MGGAVVEFDIMGSVKFSLLGGARSFSGMHKHELVMRID
jgi:hypothetical protein